MVKVSVTFMLSSYRCTYGKGCRGFVHSADPDTHDDVGCCMFGFTADTVEDVRNIKRRVSQLTDEDWDPEARARLQGKKWYTRRNVLIPSRIESKVFNGRCVFSNAADSDLGRQGKAGCAFHHLANRLGEHPSDVKPETCWLVPLRYEENWDYKVLASVASEDWHFGDPSYPWCIELPDNYQNPRVLSIDFTVLVRMEKEIRKILGDADYDTLYARCLKYLDEYDWPRDMPGAYVNKGEPLLPIMTIGKRPPPGWHDGHPTNHQGES